MIISFSDRNFLSKKYHLTLKIKAKLVVNNWMGFSKQNGIKDSSEESFTYVVVKSLEQKSNPSTKNQTIHCTMGLEPKVKEIKKKVLSLFYRFSMFVFSFKGFHY